MTECVSRLAWKALLCYVDGHFQVPIQFETDCASVSDPSEALFVEWIRRYIYDVVPATDEKVLRYMDTVYGSLSGPDYSLGGAVSSAEASDSERHRFEWLALHGWTNPAEVSVSPAPPATFKDERYSGRYKTSDPSIPSCAFLGLSCSGCSRPCLDSIVDRPPLCSSHQTVFIRRC